MQRGIAIIPTAPEVLRNADTHYSYRYDSNFYYLSGFTEPEAVLVLIAGDQPQSILFCREKNPEREIWDGHRFGPDAAQEQFGFDAAYSIALLDEKLTELLGNLLDNARKWAKTTVRVRYAPPYLVIEDDGPGVPEEDLKSISERGRRLDESKQGSGLGLSIVEDIADIYGLTVSFGRSELGGLRVEIRV